MARLHIDRKDLAEVMEEINRIMCRERLFVSVRVMPYQGKRWPKETTLTILIG